MKTLQELINREEPAWPQVLQWVAEATNPVEVLTPPEDATREQALIALQVTTRSPMGAIVYESGGILVDHGWIRILGSGHPRLPRILPQWNLDRAVCIPGEPPPFLLVADDAIGGFFAIDGGGLGLDPGKICYYAPDTLDWENTELSYSQFLTWCFGGDLALYYEKLRWAGWQEELQTVRGDQAFHIYPPMIISGPPIRERSRRPIPLAEIYGLYVGDNREKETGG